MRNKHISMNTTTLSILVMALIGGIVTFALFILLLVPLALLIRVFGM